MDLRELKKEVQELINLEETTKKFRESWLKPLKTNTNIHLPFLQKLSPQIKEQLNRQLLDLKGTLDYVQNSQIVNQKLAHHAHHLIELKLTTFNGDQEKSKAITHTLLHDKLYNLKETIMQIQSLEEQLQQLQKGYETVNSFLEKNLPLEESLSFSEMPHKYHLSELLSTMQKQKRLVKDIGQHFVFLTAQTQLKNRN